jgi:hypothetical protein
MTVRETRYKIPKTELRKATNTSSKATAALVSVDKPLTDQQKLFIHHWAHGESIYTASEKAGYADVSYGYRIKEMPNARALYDKYKREYEEVGKMTKQKVMNMHLEAFEMAKLMAEPSSMVAAAREVGKLCGYYEPTRTNINISMNGSVTMQQMAKLSDAELLKIIEEGGLNDEPKTLGMD